MITHQPWMLFQPEGVAVHYMWNGKFAVLVHVDVDEGKNEDWYWAGNPVADLDQSEVELLNDMAAAKRKQLFKVPRKGARRFIVTQRGVFEKCDV